MITFKQPKILDCWYATVGAAAIKALGSLGGGALSGGGMDAGMQADAMHEQMQFNRHEAHTARMWAEEQGRRDIALQREFAQHGVGMKIQDARNHGIDPLAALGSTTFASPVGKSVAPAQAPGVLPSGGSRRSGSWLHNLGQDLGNAFERFMTKEQVTAKLEADRLQVEGLHLDNDWKLMRNMEYGNKINGYQTQVGVPAPSADGYSQVVESQGDGVDVVKDRVVRHQDGHKLGLHAMKQYRLGRPNDQGVIPIYSAIEQEAGDAMDADLPTKARYNAREWGRIFKSWSGWTPRTRPKITKKGYYLRWNRAYAQWELAPNRLLKQRPVWDVDDVKKVSKNPTYKRFKIR